MSTNSFIGYLKDNKVTYIYCHSDGYIYYNGNILSLFYTYRERVRELVELGDISCLGCNVAAPRKFGEDEGDSKINLLASLSRKNLKTSFCVAYHRDRNEKWDNVKPKSCSLRSYIRMCSENNSYGYLFIWEEDKWYITSDGTDKDNKSYMFDLNRMGRDFEYFENYKSITGDWTDFDYYRKYRINLRNNYSENVLVTYNRFLQSKKVNDVEFDYVSDGHGKRVWGLLSVLKPGKSRRKVLVRSACIGDCLLEVLNNYPVSLD